MAGKKKRKKLTMGDISTSSKNISHSISKIKANECKITVILVVVFLCLFGVIGYFVSSIDSTKLFNSVSGINIVGVSFSSNIFTLSSDSIMSDEEGLKSNPHIIKMSNRFSYDYNYLVSLKENDNLKSVCDDCKSIDKSLIRYSIDGVTVKSLENDTLDLGVGSIEEDTDKEMAIRLWLSDGAVLDEDSIFNGMFNFTEVKALENN